MCPAAMPAPLQSVFWLKNGLLLGVGWLLECRILNLPCLWASQLIMLLSRFYQEPNEVPPEKSCSIIWAAIKRLPASFDAVDRW